MESLGDGDRWVWYTGYGFGDEIKCMRKLLITLLHILNKHLNYIWSQLNIYTFQDGERTLQQIGKKYSPKDSFYKSSTQK